MNSTRLRGCFVTGTDTEIGKTCVSAGLLHLLGRAGLRVAGFKPVAAGAREVAGRWLNDDVEALRAAGSVARSADEVCPCLLRTPCAPHIAARIDGTAISRTHLSAAASEAARGLDALVVEGVGGFCVPLGDDWDSADLACDLALPVVLVVGLRLGCINHALLSAQAVRDRGHGLAGWVANTVDPAMAEREANLHTLTQWLAERFGAPRLGVVPRLADPSPASVALHLDADAVFRALAHAGDLSAETQHVHEDPHCQPR